MNNTQTIDEMKKKWTKLTQQATDFVETLLVFIESHDTNQDKKINKNIVEQKDINHTDVKKDKKDKKINKIYNYKTKKEICNYSDKQCLNELTCVFNYMKIHSQRQIHTKCCKYIKTIMKKLFFILDNKTYVDKVHSNLNELLEICKKNKYNNSKTESLISKAISTVDIRVIGYNKFTDIGIDVSDLELYCKYIKNKMSIINTHDLSKIFEYMNTCLFSLMELKGILEMTIPFMNIVYVDDECDFNYYILDDIKDNTRYWKQDTYLINFTEELISNYRTYGVILFRDIYFKIFNDNEYRDYYKNYNIITENDCQQIIQNIYYMNDKKVCNELIREIIKNKCKYTPCSEWKDKFDLKKENKRKLIESDSISIPILNKNLFNL